MEKNFIRSLVSVTLCFAFIVPCQADELGGIVLKKDKSGRLHAEWKGNHRPGSNEPTPTDEHIARLAEHLELEVINFDGQMGGATGLNGKGFEALQALPRLTEVRLNGVNVLNMQTSEGAVPFRHEGFEALANLPHLRVVWIQHAHLPVDGLCHLLRHSQSLEELTAGTMFCDELLAAIANAPKLKKLKLGHWDHIPKNAPLTEEGYRSLQQAKHLESLDTGVRHPTGVPWKSLFEIMSSMPSLKSLTVQAGDEFRKLPKGHPGPEPFDHAAVARLESLSQLTDLGLWNARFAPGALAALHKCPHLKQLTLRGCEFDESEAFQLKTSMPGLTIFVVDGQPIQQRKL